MHPQADRLYIAAKELAGISGQTAVANALGITPQVMYNWESRGISKRGMLDAQRIFGCSSMWLETGAGQMSSNIAPAPLGSRPIPLIDFVQAGNWAEVMDSYAMGAGNDYLLTDLDLSPNAFALEIKGDSMLPDFKPGDRVIIDPEIAPQPGDFVVAKNGAEEATFKKYRPRSVNEHGEIVFELVPLNDDYPILRSDTCHIAIVGVMVEYRKYRRR